MTAVEYLIEQLQAPCRGIPSHIVELAKEIEKRDIVNAWNDGNLIGRNGMVIEDYTNGEGYYKKNYKK